MMTDDCPDPLRRPTKANMFQVPMRWRGRSGEDPGSKCTPDPGGLAPGRSCSCSTSPCKLLTPCWVPTAAGCHGPFMHRSGLCPVRSLSCRPAGLPLAAHGPQAGGLAGLPLQRWVKTVAGCASRAQVASLVRHESSFCPPAPHECTVRGNPVLCRPRQPAARLQRRRDRRHERDALSHGLQARKSRLPCIAALCKIARPYLQDLGWARIAWPA